MKCPRCLDVTMAVADSGCTYEIMSCPKCGYREEDILDIDKIFNGA